MTARIRTTENGVAFRCPGCSDMHVVPTSGPTAWAWNGSRDRPTITPSIDVKSGHHASSWAPGDECWCSKDYGFACYHCHAIVTDGRIYFCADSSHALANQTVDLPDITTDP